MRWALALAFFFAGARGGEYRFVDVASGDARARFRFHRSLGAARGAILESDLAALAALPEAREASPLHRRFFGGSVSGERYLGWLAARVRGFRFKADADLSARTIPRRGRDIVALSQHYFSRTEALDRLGILVHEGRHADGAAHVGCADFWEVAPDSARPLDWIRRQEMCDADATGAFAAQLVFLANVLRVRDGAAPADIEASPAYARHRRFIPYAAARAVLAADLLAPALP